MQFQAIKDLYQVNEICAYKTTGASKSRAFPTICYVVAFPHDLLRTIIKKKL